jgi:hypothetical protein
MTRIALGAGLVALVAAATAWALPGPVVTRGSAAIPPGCGPAASAALVAARAADDSRHAVYVAVLPNRALAPDQAELRAGIAGTDGAFLIRARADCAAHTVLTWESTPQPGGFKTTGPCPQPKGWKAGGPIVACAGLPTAWETSDDFRAKLTSQRRDGCGSIRARRRVLSLLRALDYGRSAAFGAAFAPKGTYHPYTASLATAFFGRAAITAFAKKRVGTADGWTATSLSGPTAKAAKTAAYVVSLIAYTNGRPVGAGTARMTLDCRSGLIRNWRGPALPLPR